MRTTPAQGIRAQIIYPAILHARYKGPDSNDSPYCNYTSAGVAAKGAMMGRDDVMAAVQVGRTAIERHRRDYSYPFTRHQHAVIGFIGFINRNHLRRNALVNRNPYYNTIGDSM
ncbi:hypothetical protein ANO14919_088060 [Xylariales sp. No.14919]|nr:hypothetical protein ANO14919_088060 [Xylariales sp. No.14919]